MQKDFFHIDKEATDAGAGSLKRDPNPMHYYKALVENVIDGDTILARVDFGFNIPFIVIKTYKTDLYDRFVADVFYHPTLKNKEDVAEDGIFLNQEILKAGFAKSYE